MKLNGIFNKLGTKVLAAAAAMAVVGGSATVRAQSKPAVQLAYALRAMENSGAEALVASQTGGIAVFAGKLEIASYFGRALTESERAVVSGILQSSASTQLTRALGSLGKALETGKISDKASYIKALADLPLSEVVAKTTSVAEMASNVKVETSRPLAPVADDAVVADLDLAAARFQAGAKAAGLPEAEISKTVAAYNKLKSPALRAFKGADTAKCALWKTREGLRKQGDFIQGAASALTAEAASEAAFENVYTRDYQPLGLDRKAAAPMVCGSMLQSNTVAATIARGGGESCQIGRDFTGVCAKYGVTAATLMSREAAPAVVGGTAAR